MKAVKLTKLVQEMNLKNLTPEVDMEHVRITLPDSGASNKYTLHNR